MPLSCTVPGKNGRHRRDEYKSVEALRARFTPGQAFIGRHMSEAELFLEYFEPRRHAGVGWRCGGAGASQADDAYYSIEPP